MATSSRQPQKQEAASPASAADHLARLIAIERQARKSESVAELKFTMVNSSHRLVPYHQAILCEQGGQPTAVSGVVTVEANTPWFLWIRSLAKSLEKRFPEPAVLRLCRTELAGSEPCVDEWQKWLPDHLLFCPLSDRNGNRLGQLLLFRGQPFQAQEAALLDVLADTYAHAWLALGGPGKRRPVAGKIRRFRAAFLLVPLLLVSLLRVPESVLAPAEIVAVDPVIITAGVPGQIREIAVQPYQTVEKGQLLFQLDDTELTNRLVLAEKSLEVVKADYLRAEQKAFYDPAAKGELEVLRLQVKEKELEVSYSRDELRRQQVTAPQSGLVIFRDRNDWLGRPIAVGEKVMTLADPGRAEIEISMPVDDAISLEKGAKVKLFLRTDPLNPINGLITRTSYKAEERPGGSMFFTLRAKFDGTESARIGLQGTAKVYGDSVSLLYYLFRKPLAVIRRNLGV